MAVKQADQCRLCFSLGFFHLNLFNAPQPAAQAIRDVFHCEVTVSLSDFCTK